MGNHEPDEQGAYLPNQAEIAEGCRQIRETWTETERIYRLTGLRKHEQPEALAVKLPEHHAGERLRWVDTH